MIISLNKNAPESQKLKIHSFGKDIFFNHGLTKISKIQFFFKEMDIFYIVPKFDCAIEV